MSERPVTGICLFGRNVDPMEFVLQVGVLIVLLFPAARRSAAADFTWQEGLGWVGAMSAGSALVRLTPTQRLNAYRNIFSDKTSD